MCIWNQPVNMDKLNCVSVEDQYQQFPDLNRNEVHKLLDWIQKQPHFPNITGKNWCSIYIAINWLTMNLLEFEMILFFHACECKVEATKVCIDNYYTVRTHCPEYFAKRDVRAKDLAQVMDTV